MPKKQKVKMVVKMHYSYDGLMYEMRPARGFTLIVEGATPDEVADVEDIYAALDWVSLGELAEAARRVLEKQAAFDVARHEVRRR